MIRRLAFLLSVVVICSCAHYEEAPLPMSSYRPILMNKSQLLTSITYISSKPINNPGKYILSGNYLFIVEPYQGIHIFDRSDISKPADIGFITVPGINNISIKGDLVYADNSSDVVTINIHDPVHPKVICRLENILPQPTPPDGLALDSLYLSSGWPANTAIVGWEKIKK